METHISNFLSIPEVKQSKFDYEFQELCCEMEKYIGKSVWILPHKPGFTEHKIRKAFEIAKRKNILTLPYIIGIVKRDKSL